MEECSFKSHTFLTPAHVFTQVPVLSAMFFVLFLGNSVTTSMVIPQKFQEEVGFKYQLVGLERLSWGGSGSKQHGTQQNQSSTTQVSTACTSVANFIRKLRLIMPICLP